jgi:hypothetical protein
VTETAKTEAKTLDRIDRAFNRNPYWTGRVPRHESGYAKYEAYCSFLQNAQMKESLQWYEGVTVAGLIELAKAYAEENWAQEA